MEPETEKKGVSGRVLAVVIVTIILGAVVTGGLFSYFRSGSTTPTLSPVSSGQTVTVIATSQSTQPASTFATPGYSLQVTRLSIVQGPFQQAQGNAFIINLDASYTGSGTWSVDPANFEAVSNTSAVYRSFGGAFTGLTNPLAGVVLANSQHSVGQISFLLPPGQIPAQLEYLNQTAKINAHTQGALPLLTYVCDSPAVQTVLTNQQVIVSTTITASYPNAIVQTGGYYLSGDQITVPVSPPGVPSSAPTQPGYQVTGIATNSSGVSIARIQPTIPAQAQSFSVTIASPSGKCLRSLTLLVTIAKTPPTLSVTNFSFAAAGPGGQVTISNSGTKPVVIKGVSLVYSGQGCGVGYGGTSLGPNSVYVFSWTYDIKGPCGTQAQVGQAYTGTVEFSDGEQIPFTGTFQGSPGGQAAQIAVTGTALLASDFTANASPTNFVCVTANPTAPFLVVTNTGAGSAGIISISITWAGSNSVFSPGAACNIGASGTATATTYIDFAAASHLTAPGATSGIAGQTYTGAVTLTNGLQSLFTGTWQ